MKEILKQAIEGSGNRLLLKVDDLLTRDKWIVQLTPYYVDDLTSTPREIDIIASRRISVNDNFEKEITYFWLHLIIECKHLTKEMVFYEFKNQEPFDPVSAIRSGDLNRSEILADDMSFSKNHHYVQAGRTARLYDLARGDVASTADDVFKAITQAIKALIFQEYAFQGKEKSVALYYPIVIYDGIDGIWTLDDSPEPDTANAKLQKRHLYALQYAYRDMVSNIKKDWFVIDFVHWDNLGNLLEDIAKDRFSLINNLRFRFRDKI